MIPSISFCPSSIQDPLSIRRTPSATAGGALVPMILFHQGARHGVPERSHPLMILRHQGRRVSSWAPPVAARGLRPLWLILDRLRRFSLVWSSASFYGRDTLNEPGDDAPVLPVGGVRLVQLRSQHLHL